MDAIAIDRPEGQTQQRETAAVATLNAPTRDPTHSHPQPKPVYYYGEGQNGELTRIAVLLNV